MFVTVLRQMDLQMRHMKQRVKRCLCTIGAAFTVIMCVTSPATALNGFSRVVNCTQCSTSSDFLSAAVNAAQTAVAPGTYHVISLSQPRSAYIKVIGTVKVVPAPGQNQITPNSPRVLINVTATPIDEMGNSLAGLSESALQASFAASDQLTFGANRATNFTAINVPPGDYSTFVCNCDLQEMGTGVAGWITSQFNTQTETLPVGTIVTLRFADGTTAQFQKKDAMSTYRWGWNGKAFNKQGQPIDAHGVVQGNQNTSGAGGGEVTTAPAPGVQDLTFQLTGIGDCAETMEALNALGQLFYVELQFHFNC
jgi:hypothetical protein